MVDALVLPQISITSPANNSVVKRKSTVTVSASVTPGSDAIRRVDFLVNAGVVCSDAASPYNCNWQVPARGSSKSFQLQAKAYDTRGSVVPSAIVTVSPQ